MRSGPPPPFPGGALGSGQRVEGGLPVTPVDVGPAGPLRIAFTFPGGILGGPGRHSWQPLAGTLARAPPQFEMDQYRVLPAQRAHQRGVPRRGLDRSRVSVVGFDGDEELNSVWFASIIPGVPGLWQWRIQT